jgi:outer membrane lipoprotein-sorting protein
MAALVLLTAVLAGCAATQKHAVARTGIRPTMDAGQTELLDAYNRQADAIHTVNASVLMSPTAGLAYSGVIHQYHQVSGFVLAARPEMIRVIGQAPVVGTNIFDMVSDGQMFRIFIPSKNQFLVGPTQFERTTKNPIENLRPQHLLDALFWTPIGGDQPTVLEQMDIPPARFYVLTVLRGSSPTFDVARKIWFDRSDLRVSRLQIYGPEGRLDSDISYADWQDVAPPNAPANTQNAAPPNTSGEGLRASPPLTFPRTIRVTRPQQDYQLVLTITKIAVNAEIPADGFKLPQPAGTELVNVGTAQQEPQP